MSFNRCIFWNVLFLEYSVYNCTVSHKKCRRSDILRLYSTFDLLFYFHFVALRGYCTPDQKLACFVLYLKIVNIFLKKTIYACYSKFSKKLKNGIEILVGQAVLKLWIKTLKMLFGSITQEPFGLPKFLCRFWVPWTICYKMHISFLKKVLIIFW